MEALVKWAVYDWQVRETECKMKVFVFFHWFHHEWSRKSSKDSQTLWNALKPHIKQLFWHKSKFYGKICRQMWCSDDRATDDVLIALIK